MDSETFEFVAPRLIFGNGCIKDAGAVAKELGATKVFIVTEKGIVKAGLLDKLKKPLEDSGLNYEIWDKVSPNPRDNEIEKIAKAYKEAEANLLMGIGGGSAMDAAKAAGILVTNKEPINQYEGCNKFKNPIPPLIAIPTTSGTGSEASMWCVITDTRRNAKMSLGGPGMLPKVALVDPALTKGLPPDLTAGTGMDALSHAVESYLSTGSIPPSDALALHSIRLVVENLPLAVANGENMEARTNMALASFEANLAASNTGCGAVHSLGHQLTTDFGVHHGISMGIMMPYVMQFNMIGCMARMRDIAEAMGEDTSVMSDREAALQAAVAIYELQKDMGLVTGLKEVGVKGNDIAGISEKAFLDVDMSTNPRRATVEDIKMIYKTALEENEENIEK